MSGLQNASGIGSFPQEVIDLIVDFLCDNKEALRSCTLTSRSWLSRSHCYLLNWKHTIVGEIGFQQPLGPRAAFIRHLQLEGHTRVIWETRGDEAEYPRIFDRLLPKLLSALPNARILTISKIRLVPDHHDKRAFTCSWGRDYDFGHITELNIENTTYVASLLLYIVASLPQISSLRFIEANVLSRPLAMQWPLPLRCLITLQELTIDCGWTGQNGNVLKGLNSFSMTTVCTDRISYRMTAWVEVEILSHFLLGGGNKSTRLSFIVDEALIYGKQIEIRSHRLILTTRTGNPPVIPVLRHDHARILSIVAEEDAELSALEIIAHMQMPSVQIVRLHIMGDNEFDKSGATDRDAQLFRIDNFPVLERVELSLEPGLNLTHDQLRGRLRTAEQRGILCVNLDTEHPFRSNSVSDSPSFHF